MCTISEVHCTQNVVIFHEHSWTFMNTYEFPESVILEKSLKLCFSRKVRYCKIQNYKNYLITNGQFAKMGHFSKIYILFLRSQFQYLWYWLSKMHCGVITTIGEIIGFFVSVYFLFYYGSINHSKIDLKWPLMESIMGPNESVKVEMNKSGHFGHLNGQNWAEVIPHIFPYAVFIRKIVGTVIPFFLKNERIGNVL